jgi:L-rhamnose mutarotase
MQRVAFQLRIRKNKVEEYDRAHEAVWPELLERIRSVGISDYSIFRRHETIILVMRVEDFDRAWERLAQDPVNQRWQEKMSEIFEETQDVEPGERFPMLKEVFYME